MKSLLMTVLAIFLISSGGFSEAAKETVMYKKIDENGKVIFTDKPIPGSTPIKIKTDVNTVKTPKPVTRPQGISPEAPRQTQKSFQYEVLSIDSPQNDQAIRENSGNVNVVVGLTPNLQTNHSLQLIMDDVPVGSQQKIPYFTLSNIDRGTHRLLVKVIDDSSNEAVQTSQTVTFHLLRTSILNNNF